MRIYRLLLPLALVCSGPLVHAAPVFQDGFEAEALGGEWSLSGTNNGRIQISTANQPATGTKHLILDDSVSDAISSAAEASLILDLTGKKNVVLSFKVKSLGNEPNTPPSGNFIGTRNYDGVAVSTDGGTTWRSVQSLAAVTSSWQTCSVTLDSSVGLLGGSFGPGFRIRFSGYDNSPAPIDGIAIDDVSVTAVEDQRLVVELPTPVNEGSGPHTGYVMLALASTQPMTVSLSASPSGQVTLPSTVSIPAGETYQSFSFSVNGDNVVNGTRTLTFNATAPDTAPGSAELVILDDDVVKPTLTLPADVTEGAAPVNNATLSLDRVAAMPITVSLTADPPNELTLPGSVTIPAGQTQVSFTVRATDDTRIDGSISVSVAASIVGGASTSSKTLTIDNEQRVLALSLPATLSEGATGNGSVTLTGTLAQPLTVSLSSPQSAALGFPATVTIPAGQTQVAFALTATDNTLRDGSRQASLTAQAISFASATKALTLRDNEVASYRFGELAGILNISSPVAITLTAADVEGNIITGPSGSVNLSVVLPDGSSQALQPGSVTLSAASGYSGNVTLPAIATAPLRLRASGADGNTGESTPFDIMRVIPLVAGDLAWDSGRSRLYASVPLASGGTYANKVVAIDPQTLAVTGSVTTNQNPGQLALTSGGEYLYASLNANGTVARINPTTLSVASTFAIGTSTSYGTLYAEDISTVAGQPNLLVVSQYRKSVSPRHNGVAVYDNGVVRAVKTGDHTGSNLIEASADPTVFFGQNTESTEYGFRKMKIDANGIIVSEVVRDLIPGFGSDMRSDGNKVFAMSGGVIDGSQMKRLGSFSTSGVVRPDLASSRVYFLESSDPSYYYSTYNRLSAYDPHTFARIKTLALPVSYAYDEVKSFIRWGTNGLAFRTGTSIVLVNSSQLVPSEAPANLAVSVQATPNPATVGAPLTYTVQVTNQGPNVSRGTTLTAVLSDSQTLVSTVASNGTPVVSGVNIVTPVGELAVGATATLTITTTPQSAGSLTCTGSASSFAIDPDGSNNLGFQLVSVGFQSGPDVVNQLRLAANNLIYDSGRSVFWATIPGTVPAPLGRSVVSINPQTGLISQPIAINASPMNQSMALSANGRYLYIGLSDVPEVHRIDLSTNPSTSNRITLGSSQWGSLNYAQDLEVLDGDGTSFLMAGSDDHGAAAYDGNTLRGTRTGIYSVDSIERSAVADTFLGYDNYTSGFELSKLAVTSTGVSISQSASNVISGYNVDLCAEGGLLLSSNGRVVDSSTLTLKSNLGISGRPAVDSRYQRVYLVVDNAIRGYDANTGTSIGTFALPTTMTGDWAQSCTRWGADGFGVLGNDGKIYIARWSDSIPEGADENIDGIADTWASQHFGTLAMNPAADADGDRVVDALEYLFGTNPCEKGPSPLRCAPVSANGGAVLHLTFPRRVGIDRESYDYQTSTDLRVWDTVNDADVVETVISTQTVNGLQTETLDVAIPIAKPGNGFVRLKWLQP